MARISKPQHVSWLQGETPNLFCLPIFFLVAFVLYGGSYDNPLVFDSASGLKDINLDTVLKNFQFFGLRSFPWLSFSLIHLLFGDDWFWQYVFNVFLHAVNATLVYTFLKLLFQRVVDEKISPLTVHTSWVAFFAALLFLIHPISLYATAYLVQRTIQVGMFFSLLSLIFYLQGLVQNRRWWLLASACFYFFSAHSKEHCITLPAVFLILTLMVGPFSFREWLKKQAWIFVLCAFIAVEVVLRSKGALGKIYEPHALGMISNAAKQSGTIISAENAYLLSIMTQAYMYFRYMFLWLIPIPRMIFIDIHLPFPTSFFSWPETLMLFFYWVSVAGSFWLVLKKGFKALVGFALLSSSLLFLTELSAVRLSEQFVLYRSYFWVTGFVSLVPLLIFKRTRFPLGQNLRFALMLFYMAVLIFVSRDRLKTFDSELALWRDVVEKVDRQESQVMYKNYRPFNNLANKLTDLKQFDEALEYYKIGLKLNPNLGLARTNLGIFFFKQEKYEEAMKYFRDSVEKEPGYVQAYVGWGMSLYKLGDFSKAIELYNRALKINPQNADALFNKGNVYYKLNDFKQAADLYSQSLQINSVLDDVHYNLALAYARDGQHARCIETFAEMLKKWPQHPRKIDATYEMANAYFRLGDLDRAEANYAEVVMLKPDAIDAYYNLGIVQLKKKNLQKARVNFKKVLELSPGHANALKHLGQIGGQDP